MSDGAILAVVLVLVVGLAVTATAQVNRYNRARKKWRVDELDVPGNAIQVVCRRGRAVIRIGAPVVVDADDFNDVIEERRVEAHMRAVGLNRRDT